MDEEGRAQAMRHRKSTGSVVDLRLLSIQTALGHFPTVALTSQLVENQPLTSRPTPGDPTTPPDTQPTIVLVEFLTSLALSGRFAERFERCAHFGDEDRRLLPGGEVGAFGELVIVD